MIVVTRAYNHDTMYKKKGRVNSRIISTDEDPSLRIESSAIINLRGVSTKLNKYKNFYRLISKRLKNKLLQNFITELLLQNFCICFIL